jgi:hypothetical protein
MGGMYYQEPPEAQSIKSMLHIARIVALIFGIIFLLVGLALLALGALVTAATAGIGAFTLIPGFLLLLWFVFDLIIYMKLKGIEAMVNNRQYEQAKGATLIWMILGFIIGGIIVGILVLIAYLKFDPLITAQRNMAGGAPPPGGFPPQPGYYAAPPPAGAPPAAPPPQPPMAAPPAAGAPAAAPICPRCGQPATYIAQYGRYYCYNDKQYV